MFKFGDKVIIRDGTVLEGVQGIVYRIEDNKISVLLEREVFWHVEQRHLEHLQSSAPDQPGAV